MATATTSESKTAPFYALPAEEQSQYPKGAIEYARTLPYVLLYWKNGRLFAEERCPSSAMIFDAYLANTVLGSERLIPLLMDSFPVHVTLGQLLSSFGFVLQD